MEIPDLKFITQGFFSFFAEFTDLDLTNFVGYRLAGPGDVAVNFGVDLVKGKRGVGSQIFYRLLAGPAQGMHSCVYHQSAGTPLLVGEFSKEFVRRGVDPHFFSKEFGIQSPAFPES